MCWWGSLVHLFIFFKCLLITVKLLSKLYFLNIKTWKLKTNTGTLQVYSHTCLCAQVNEIHCSVLPFRIGRTKLKNVTILLHVPWKLKERGSYKRHSFCVSVQFWTFSVDCPTAITSLVFYPWGIHKMQLLCRPRSLDQGTAQLFRSDIALLQWHS